MGVGRSIPVEELAKGMVRLQKRGVHNINLVTPTHQVAAIARALLLAVPLGLNIPIVYNTSGYERVETLRLLEGIVDVYLPDIKYDNPGAAHFCSRRRDYVEHNRAALLEMWRQVGPLEIGPDGLARKGMLVRHMVLPGGLSGSRGCLEFLAREFGAGVPVSLMNQYFPAHKAFGAPPLDRKTSDAEYGEALALLDEFHLENGFVQEHREEDDS
jgi:putative pyruvate formate lyase activating enzyme